MHHPSNHVRQTGAIRRCLKSARGASMVEFALVAPLLLLILFGVIAYGGYFWRAHALQQVANDAARAALAGLTANERAALARSSVASEITELSGLSVKQAEVSVSEVDETILVRLDYDATSDPFFKLGLVPLPSPVIKRQAVVRLGGL